ncbi:hypothetical protein GDO78_020610 [Eleutherodactylus coqui]|uniref:Uncharacterized protein n=1 Tax=Eleutherodactylus coqui TaxID=57060 RepID=A0A8J6B6H1_ELECQ|nr:hypothetical protein GDO78_020610 [Eleutherodactylus coqui]
MGHVTGTPVNHTVECVQQASVILVSNKLRRYHRHHAKAPRSRSLYKCVCMHMLGLKKWYMNPKTRCRVLHLFYIFLLLCLNTEIRCIIGELGVEGRWLVPDPPQ